MLYKLLVKYSKITYVIRSAGSQDGQLPLRPPVSTAARRMTAPQGWRGTSGVLKDGWEILVKHT